MTRGKKLFLTGLLLTCPAVAFAGEECSMMGGICRDACGADEEIEVGAFLDCTDRQDCCVKKRSLPDSPGNMQRKDGHPGGDKRDLPSGEKAK